MKTVSEKPQKNKIRAKEYTTDKTKKAKKAVRNILFAIFDIG